MIPVARAFLYGFGVLILIGGVTAFAVPSLITEKFFLAPTAVAGTAEIRGLYGGGFFSFGVTTLLGLRCARLGPGLFVAMACFMACVAVARLLSIPFDHDLAFSLPAALAEVVLATLYWIASDLKAARA